MICIRISTISIMVGRGSVNHNRRAFIAENVDKDRTEKNIEFCYTPIEQVYHELFDEALQRYNDKQKRADRKIDNYYKKIRTGKQEKLFHEIIVQFGNKADNNAKSERAEETKEILTEYFNDFQERNPQLKVFSAHLHMDEETPHLHIDFVPFITGSKRGLDTRVSLKQALFTQGFQGGSRNDTEWNQWVDSEKEALASVMSRYWIEWEHKGTHKPHLSVLDFKKQEREKEIAVLDEKIKEREFQYSSLGNRIENRENEIKELDDVENLLESDDYQLPEPPTLMTAKSYKQKFVDPLIEKFKQLVKSVLLKAFEGWDKYYQANRQNNRWARENNELSLKYDNLLEEYQHLYKFYEKYNLLMRTFGPRRMDALINEAHEKVNQRKARNRNNHER